MHGSEGGEAPAFPTPIMFDVCYGVCVGVRRLTTNLRNRVVGMCAVNPSMDKIFEIQL